MSFEGQSIEEYRMHPGCWRDIAISLSSLGHPPAESYINWSSPVEEEFINGWIWTLPCKISS